MIKNYKRHAYFTSARINIYNIFNFSHFLNFKIMKTKSEKSDKNKFIKKKKKETQETKKVKLIVNLTKCSQNWAKVATSLPPKPVFKRQSLKQQQQQAKETTKSEDNKKIWFEVDKTFLPQKSQEKEAETEPEIDSSGIRLLEPKSDKKLITKALAVDCEMVGVGENGKDSILARISIVNQLNDCIYDKYVLPTETVTDYRTSVSGIRPSDLKKSNNAVTGN
jgi:RNA exonuclease 4